MKKILALILIPLAFTVLATAGGRHGPYFWIESGSGAIAPVPGKFAAVSTYARVSGANVTTSNTSLEDIAGLSVSLAANAVYEFEASLSIASSSTAGVKYGVNFSAAGATVEGQEAGTNAATSAKAGRISAFNTAGIVFSTVAADGSVVLRGIVTTGANAGVFTVQHLKVTSGTATCYIGSLLKITRIE